MVTGALHFQDPDATSLQWKARVCLSKLGARLATLNVAISEVEAGDLAFLPKGRAVEVPDQPGLSPGQRSLA